MFGSVSAALTAALLLVGSASASHQDLVKRQRPGLVQCAARYWQDVPNVLKGCNYITFYNLTVPAGETLDLSSAVPGAVIFFGREITFGYKKWTGPLIRFKGNSNLYVNGGTANLLAQGTRYWGKTGQRPTLVEIDGVSNSVFEKFNITSAPTTAIHVKNSANLQFKRPRVVNIGGDGNIGLRITNSRGISVVDGQIYTQADGLQVNSVNGLTVGNSNFTYGGVTLGATSGAVNINNVKISGVRVVGAKTGLTIAGPPTGAGVKAVTISDVVLDSISGVGVRLAQNTQASTQAPFTGISLAAITGSVLDTAQKFQFTLANGACRGLAITGIQLTGGKTSACSCTPTGFQCR